MHNLKLQRLSPDGTETLLDLHLRTFDEWFRVQLLSLSASSWPHCYFTVATLLDHLDPKEYNWQQVSVILQDHLLPAKLPHLFGGTKANIEFFRIVSKFLMDRERARLFWVNSQRYVDLARDMLKFLRNK